MLGGEEYVSYGMVDRVEEAAPGRVKSQSTVTVVEIVVAVVSSPEFCSAAASGRSARSDKRRRDPMIESRYSQNQQA